MGIKARMIFGSFCWFFLTAAILLPLVGCDAGRKASTKAPAAVGPDPMKQAGLVEYWQRQLTLAPNERIESVTLLDENLYFVTNQKNLIAMDARSGVTKWSLPVTLRTEKVFAPIAFDGMKLPKQVGTVDDITNPPSQLSLPAFDAVIINTLTNVKVINRSTGEVIRDIHFADFSATNCGATDGKRFFVSGSDNQIHVILLLPAVEAWAEDIGERVFTPLICGDEKLFVGTSAGIFRCFFADDRGVQQWKIRLDSPIKTPFAVAGGNAYIAAQDGRIYAFGTVVGQEIWQPVDIQGTPAGPLLIGESTIYQYGQGGGISAINIANGLLRWNIPTGRDILAVMGDNVYVLDLAKNIQVANTVTGKTSQTIPMKKFDLFATNINTSAIYAATNTGEICCIRQASAPKLTAEMIK